MPAIDVCEDVSKTILTQDEIDKMYKDSKDKIESDLDKQKEKINAIGKEINKSETYEGIDGIDSFKLNKSSIATLSSESVLSTISSTASTTSQTVLQPYDLDGEFLRATANGDRAILKWAPSGNEDGYNVYRIDTGDPNRTSSLVGSTTVEKYDNTFSGLLPTSSHEYEFFVRAYKLVNGSTVESADSNHIIVARGNITISSNKTLQINHVYEKIDITGGTLDLNGKMLKVCYEFNHKLSSIINVNNGKLVALSGYTIQDNATLKMVNSGDYVYIGGNLFFQTSVIHDVTKLNNGTIYFMGKDFKRLGTVGNFKPSGDHRVYLTGLDSNEITLVDFGTDTQSKFNILGINKPLSKYDFIPPGRTMDQWCNKLIYVGSNENYFNFEGVYSPTGNFSRSYTDLEIPAPGPDISIGRVYNSKNSKAGILGTGWTFSYEGSVELSSAADVATVNKSDGSTSTFILSGTTSTTKTYSGMDSRDELIYNISSDNYVLTMKDKTKYGFQKVNSQYLLSYIEDYIGNRVSVSYLNGKIDKIQDSKGRIVNLEYIVENSLPKVKVTDVSSVSSSRSVVYTLNNGKLEKVTDANGYDIYCFDYTDGFKIKIAEKIENGSTVWKVLDDVKYNANGRIIKHTDLYGKVSEYEYSPNKTTIYSNVNGKVITTVEMYDEANAITEIIGDDGTRNTIEYFKNQAIGNVYYNKYNEIKSQTDNDWNKTIYDIDGNGNLKSVTNPDKSVKEYGYYTDSVLKDLIMFEKDEENNYTYYEYYSNRLLKKKYVYRTKVTQTYPNLASLNSTNSYITTYDYWPDGQIKSVIEPKYYNSNVSTQYQYNTDNGMLSKIIDPEGKTVEYTYNSYRLLESEKVLLNGYTTYQSTWYDYDKNGKLERMTACDSDTIATASKKSIERYVYDLSGRLIQKISPNQYNQSLDDLENHKYNNADVGYRYQYYLGTNKVINETDPLGNVFEYEYDENGNMLKKTEADLNTLGGTNRTTYRYTYDSRNRIKELYVTPFGGTEMWLESYEYLTPEYVSVDNYRKAVVHKKMLNTMEFLTEEIRYDYADRLIEKVSDPGTNEIRISTQYNLDGTTKSIKDGEGHTTYYYYDTMKRPVHIWTPFEGENGVTSSYTYRRFVYDDSGNKINEAILKTSVDQATFNNETSRNGIHGYAIDDRFHKSSYQYYKNNKLMESVGLTGQRMKYYYDGANNVNTTEEFKDNQDSNKITRDYTNNYLGKPANEKLYVKTGNIYGNDYNSNTDYTITTNNYYDLNGNKKIVIYSLNSRTDLYYYE